MMQIGEVSKTFQVSNRTLRYWEEKEILRSTRKENGYRYYDDMSIRRIKQIIFLRELRVPIQDIESIFKSEALHVAIEVLRNHLENTKKEAESLMSLGLVLEHLIQIISSQGDLQEALTYMEESAQLNTDMSVLRDALQIALSERKHIMANVKKEAIPEIRIIKLPKMIFATYRAESESPEDDCSKVTNPVVMAYKLHEEVGFRHFGFNNPDPTENNPVYGYEMWFTVPEDFQVLAPLERKVFSGGLYASLPTKMNVIGERWRQLWEWVQHSEDYVLDYAPEQDRWALEECMDFEFFIREDIDFSMKQLDLLMPIKRNM